MVAMKQMVADRGQFDSLIEFVYRHIEKSDALEAVARKKIYHHLSHLPSKPLSSKVVFSLNGRQHHVSLEFKLGAKKPFFCEAEDSSMYHAIDVLSGKLGRILRKEKSKSKPESDRMALHLAEEDES